MVMVRGLLYIHNIVGSVCMYELLIYDSVLIYYLMSCILQCSSTHSVQCMRLHWLTFEAGGDLINMPISGYYKLSSNYRQGMYIFDIHHTY
jgi:hypothetical protein